MAIRRPGAMLPQINKKVHNDPGYNSEEDESDEYEVGDEEDEEVESDSDDESGDEVEGGGGLTAMLLAEDPIGNDEEDNVWVPAGGREPADYSGEEDDQEEPAVPVLTVSGATSSDDKKRAQAGVTLLQKGPNDEGEESDEYEVGEDEGEEMDSNSDDDSWGEGEEGGGGLTAILLGEVSADGGDEEEDEGWIPAASDSKKRKRGNDTPGCKKAKLQTASTL